MTSQCESVCLHASIRFLARLRSHRPHVLDHQVARELGTSAVEQIQKRSAVDKAKQGSPSCRTRALSVWTIADDVDIGRLISQQKYVEQFASLDRSIDENSSTSYACFSLMDSLCVSFKYARMWRSGRM